jgi:hypothetical protein
MLYQVGLWDAPVKPQTVWHCTNNKENMGIPQPIKFKKTTMLINTILDSHTMVSTVNQ